MKITAIKTSDGYFIKSAEATNYSNDSLKNIHFGRVAPESTWKPHWYKVADVYAKAEKYTPPTQKPISYILKPEYVATDALPKEVPLSEIDWEDSRRGLYDYVMQDIPDSYEDVEIEISLVAELEGKLVQETILYPVYGRYPASEGKSWRVTNSQIKLGLVDEITTPEILREERPCELSTKDSYAIIRTYIKDHIDPKVATISSDYDFCLTVEKRIPLAEKETYRIDENFDFFSKRKRKPKMVTRYRVERKKEIYKIAPRIDGKVYSNYPEAPAFRGENARNLKANIDEYLQELIKEINRPLHDCPHCNGMGVVEK
jgi:hypothetical protein